jgi:hypothetical protein
MTTSFGPAGYTAQDNSQVGAMGDHASVDSVFFVNGGYLVYNPGDTPQRKYEVGVRSLKGGQPQQARELISEAIAGSYVNSEVMFHWLIAMVSGRVVQDFNSQEVVQLRSRRHTCALLPGDPWANGVRLIYQLLDSALPSLASPAGQATAPDMSVLVKEIDSLGHQQRDMIWPHLDLFLTGRLQDEAWQSAVQEAAERRVDGRRLGCAWMFFHPDPRRIELPLVTSREPGTRDRVVMYVSAGWLALVAGYLGWELLSAFAWLGLAGLAVALASGVAATRGDLECRFLAARLRQKDEQFRALGVGPNADELAAKIDALFRKYTAKYAPDDGAQAGWESAIAGSRAQYRDELIGICRKNGIPASEVKTVAWLAAYELRQLREQWSRRTLLDDRQLLLPRLGTVAARWIGTMATTAGLVIALIALGPHPVADVIALPTCVGAWQCWLRVTLARRNHAADCDELSRRQAAIDADYDQWKERLRSRPSDDEMAAWLQYDKTFLLGQALDHFQIPRSRLRTHAVTEERGAGGRRGQVEGGLPRYDRYLFKVFLMSRDGVRHVEASLKFVSGTPSIYKRTSFRYDAIVSAHVSRNGRDGHKLELRLKAGDPITVRDAVSVAGSTPQARIHRDEDDAALAASSVTDILHLLEGVAGEGGGWFRKQEEAGRHASTPA